MIFVVQVPLTFNKNLFEIHLKWMLVSTTPFKTIPSRSTLLFTIDLSSERVNKDSIVWLVSVVYPKTGTCSKLKSETSSCLAEGLRYSPVSITYIRKT